MAKPSTKTRRTSAAALLDRHFLDMRSALLETAATLDRIERAPGGSEVANDPRLAQVREAAGIVGGGEGNRAERLLLLLSDPPGKLSTEGHR